MKKGILIFIALALIIAVLCVAIFTGFFDKKEVKPINEISGDIISGDNIEAFETIEETYGNGTDIVNYKGNIYYIEYGNTDFTNVAVRYPWYYVTPDSNNQRYVNRIDSKGNIKNLFKVTGSDSLAIVDDRFYLKSSNGLLYTQDMNGENSIELTKGEYLAFDEGGNAVYYLNDNNPNLLYKIDTKSLTISTQKFNNPNTTSGYNFLNIRNGNLYYSYLDKSTSTLMLIEHNIKENAPEEVASLSIKLKDKKSTSDYISESIVSVQNLGKYSGICIATPTGGTMGGYADKEFYIFDLEGKTISKLPQEIAKEGDWYDDDMLNKLLFAELYKLNNDNEALPDYNSLVSLSDIQEFASKYHIDLNAKLGSEAGKESSPEEPKFVIEVEDYNVIGNNVFYKITASRRNPREDIGWRPAYIRMVTEVYIKNLKTNENKFIYSYINNNYEAMEEKINEPIEDTALSGDKNSSGEAQIPQQLKNDEMLLEISTSNIWKEEFDVKVEEVGGMIIGKRIEYEGHHKKDEGIIKVKVNKEVGAMLTVYIDGEASSQMTIEE